MRLTIDASVFVSAARPSEKNFPLSYRFLGNAKGSKIFCPTLVLVECGAAIARPTGDFILSERMINLIKNFPGMRQVPLHLPLALRGAEIAIQNRLRGADAVYVAVAEEFSATLISWDEEMFAALPGDCPGNNSTKLARKLRIDCCALFGSTHQERPH